MPRVNLVLDIIEKRGQVSMAQLNQDTGLALPDLSKILEEQVQLGNVEKKGDGLQLLFSLSPKGKARIVWWEMPEQGWIVIGANHRRVLLVLPKREDDPLTVAGYHLGAMYWNNGGDNFVVKLEAIDESEREKVLPKIRRALPPQLRGMDIAFKPPTQEEGLVRAKSS